VPISGRMDKENVLYIHNSLLLGHKEEQNYIICRKMDITRDHHFKWNKLDSEKYCVPSVTQDMKIKGR
jgi:hypothetical protein